MKIAIVNLSNQKVQLIYESDVINIRSFGGPWGDPQTVEHIMIPDSVQFTSKDELEPYNGEVQDGIESVYDGEQQAYDSENQPMVDLEGEPITVPKYIQRPVMKSIRLMRRKP